MKVRIIITALFIALLSTFFADKADASPWRDRRYYRYDRYGWRKEYRYEPRTTMRHNVDYGYHDRYYPRRYYRRYNNDRYYRDRDYRRHYYNDRYNDDRYWHDRYYHDRFDDDKYYFRGGGY